MSVGKLMNRLSLGQGSHYLYGKRMISDAASKLTGKSLLYKEFGEPAKVLQLTECQAKKDLESNEVLVKWLLAPVNPADINTIEGKYPTKPPLPAIPGNEGVGEIVDIGSSVQDLSIGDRVIPNGNNLGTWTSYGSYVQDKLIPVPKELGKLEACMLTVNPCTAYRMLKDFVTLKPGDSVIQNGGNSAVGQLVIQLCKIWKLNSINVVRDRPDIEQLKNELTELGATRVITDKECRTTDIFRTKELPNPILALNCVGGQNGVDVLRHVFKGGTMVTYGGMSREPVIVPTSALIFKEITLKGFWMTEWTKRNEKSLERWSMLKELGDMFARKELQAPVHKLVSLENYEEAVVKTLQRDGKTGVKYILDLSG